MVDPTKQGLERLHHGERSFGERHISYMRLIYRSPTSIVADNSWRSKPIDAAKEIDVRRAADVHWTAQGRGAVLLQDILA